MPISPLDDAGTQERMALILKKDVSTNRLIISQRIPLFLDGKDQFLSSTRQNSFLE